MSFCFLNSAPKPDPKQTLRKAERRKGRTALELRMVRSHQVSAVGESPRGAAADYGVQRAGSGGGGCDAGGGAGDEQRISRNTAGPLVGSDGAHFSDTPWARGHPQLPSVGREAAAHSGREI